MSAWKRRMAAGCFTIGMVTLLGATSPEARARALAADPAAVRKLRQTTALLDGLRQFSVRTQNTIGDLHVSGHPVDCDLAANVIVKLPNRLHAARAGELTGRTFERAGATEIAAHGPG